MGLGHSGPRAVGLDKLDHGLHLRMQFGPGGHQFPKSLLGRWKPGNRPGKKFDGVLVGCSGGHGHHVVFHGDGHGRHDHRLRHRTERHQGALLYDAGHLHRAFLGIEGRVDADHLHRLALDAAGLVDFQRCALSAPFQVLSNAGDGSGQAVQKRNLPFLNLNLGLGESRARCEEHQRNCRYDHKFHFFHRRPPYEWFSVFRLCERKPSTT